MSNIKDALNKVFSAKEAKKPEPEKPEPEKIDPQEALWQSEEIQKFVSEMKQKMKEEGLSYTDLAELKQKTALEPLLAEMKELEAKDMEVRAKVKNEEIGQQPGGKILRSVDLKKEKLQERINKLRNEHLIDVGIHYAASQLDCLLAYNRAIEITLSVYKKTLDLAPEINKAERFFGGTGNAPFGFTMVREAIHGLIRGEWNMRSVQKKDPVELEKYFFISLKAMWDRLSKKEEDTKIYSKYTDLLI